jgi:beta-phosphoglucomutase-like phosphatase (HAD superfamily)
MTRACRVLIFDFDGVLVDSEPVKTEAFRRIYARYPEHAQPMMRHHTEHPSISRVHKFRFLLECLGKPEDRVLLDRLLADFSAQVVEGVAACPAIAGSLEFLQSIEGRIPLYLASVTPIQDLESVLQKRQLRRFFKKVYGDPPTTKADAIREILREEACKAQDVVLIGDSEGDHVAAQETGIRFLGYRNSLPLPAGAETFTDWSELGDRLRVRQEAVR